jgi:hypothetical protein
MVIIKLSLILLFLLKLNLTTGLKSTDFCNPKEKKECKGYYDRNKTYQIKCDTIKCHGTFSYDCGSEICSKNEIDCDEYKNVDAYTKLVSLMENLRHAPKKSKKINEIELFKKKIKNCQLKPYNFKKNDFCLNGQNCFEIKKELKGFGFNYRSLITKLKIDCRCPKRQSFKCGDYCSIDSIACDYFKSINESNFRNIKYCVNYNITTYT